MKPPIFDYVAANSLDEAVAALAAAGPDAKIVAGGQSLMPMLNFRLARPSLLVDISRIPDLDTIEERGGEIVVGALVRHHKLEMSPLVAARLPVLAKAMTHVAHLAIRNRGTIGGSLAHADPAAELPMMAMLLDARFTLRSASGEREIAAADFFLDALTTALAPGEILTRVAFKAPRPGTGWAFEEIARRDGDFPLAAAAALVEVEAGRIRAPRIVLMGVGTTPVRMHDAEAALAGTEPTPRRLDDAASAIAAALDPMSDLHASADYRRHLARVLTRRVLEVAVTTAGSRA